MSDSAGWAEALTLQQGTHTLPEFVGSGGDHSRGNFFATKFKQKIWHVVMKLSSQNYGSMNMNWITVAAAGFELLASHWGQLFFLCSGHWFCGLCTFLTLFFVAVLLIHPGFGDADRQGAHSSDHANALSHRNGAAFGLVLH